MFESRAVRSAAFWAIAAFASSVHIIVAAIVIRLTTTVTLETKLYALGLAASVLDVCSLALLLASVATRRLHVRAGILTVFYGCTVAFSWIATLLSLYLLGWTVRRRDGEASQQLASAGIALLIVLILSQTGFYAYLLWPQKRHNEEFAGEMLPTERPSPAALAKRSLSVHLAYLKPVAPPFVRSACEPWSASTSKFSESPRSSWRESIQHTIRPMTSKTRLLRHSFLSTDAYSYHSRRPLSLDTIRPHDGFETWDTSAAEGVVDTPTIPQGSRYKLETIPGSRPVSPAKALDGPYPTPLAPEETPLPDSPTQSPSTEARSFQTSQYRPPLRRPSTNQSHIHPLFRGESPIPPPLPSPGTVVTASPLAGQIVSPEHALGWTLHSTQTWRPGSATPVSPTGSRTGSVRSVRLQSPSPSEPLPGSPLQDSREAYPIR